MPLAPTDSVVEVSNLTMRFGDRLVHQDIDLAVRKGETLAIVGGSGSGKTTLLREMALLLQPTSGSVRVLGNTIGDLQAAHTLSVRRHIGVLFQNGALFGGLSVLENVAFPLREHTRLGGALVREIANLKLALVGLSAADGLLFPNQLSGGMRKRVALARAIAMDPALLFLDEPTSGLDPLSADAFDELVLDLKAALDPTVVLVTHDLHTLWRVADRVVLLGEGRLLAEGSMQTLARSEDPAVVRFFRGPRGRAAQASA
ncbi:MAG: ATP-binding cassette domain-containing protein [Chromatiaceae bacterium]|nr:ATP-binding cassette domain-containing protein [Gammaproteobacteria bacterium]MCP5304298.1 ATP-binding cassette domain-containing protein [Chromatiaceae bacterium]MCP5314023.1 ATP-binding cassette domain-containing protein [Chromatiaceae bacterium]